MNRHETPTPRINPSGKRVYMARWTDKTGRVRNGWPPDIKGTYKLRREAQEAINACYAKDAAGPVNPLTVGGYFESWVDNHPRSRVTNATNSKRVRAVLDARLDGKALRDWMFGDLRRRHASLLVTFMLVEQGRAYTGVTGILASLSAMTEDAIDDEVAVGNPFKGVKVRANDPRIRKAPTAIRVWSWEEMHAFAAASSDPVMVRVLSDCGLRVGELLALRRRDLDLNRGVLEVRQTMTQFGLEAGTKVEKSRGKAEGRDVPVPPALLGMLRGMPKRIDSDLLFPAAGGGPWWYEGWKLAVWAPAVRASGMDPRPHEFRHSHISLLSAAGIDRADLAAVSGHTVQTAARYTHSLGRSFEQIKEAVG